jgi:SAM-dependent methyltransferase
MVLGCQMAEITNGVRAVLSYSRIYDLLGSILGARKGREVFSSQYIRARAGDRILDIGCGTAVTRDFLPDVEYYGFDPNPRYIKAAQNRLRDVRRCTFLCATVDEIVLGTLPKFDIVLALGVLHHLDDEAASRLANVAKFALKEKGRLIMVDPCFIEGQSIIARLLAMLDRGQHVRSLNSYRNIMNAAFGIVNTEIRQDLLLFPYTHLIMECTVE